MQSVDILILSNGPGEVTTWVLPAVKALRQKLGNDRSQIRISVVLSPCPNATGKEAAIASSYPEVDRVQSSEDFFPFLLWGKTAANWDWREVGVVLFLGGDQFFPVVIGKRLGYRTVVYAEWDARWHRWIDRFGVMKQSIIAKAPKKYRHKFTVVGDLMADVGNGDWELKKTFPNSCDARNQRFLPVGSLQCSKSKISARRIPNHQSSVNSPIELIGLLPGSKAAKLAQGLPLCLAIAQHIHLARPQTRFIIPVAPTLDLQTLARFADPKKNPVIAKVGGVSAQLVIPDSDTSEQPFLKTSEGLWVGLATQFPAYDLLSQCRLVLTTVGANTAQLAALAVPMIVLLPTQQLDAMRSWDGVPGILANLPILGSAFAKLINWLVLRQGRLFAWPNIWANEEIVPELVGELQAPDVAQMVLDFLYNREKLEEMRHRLLSVRRQEGAASQIAEIVGEQIN
ncbi:MAG: lipid-A-disaccharide synthase [Xenococcaceae cyanobacterium]